MKYFRKENLGRTITVISFLLGSILVGLYYFTEKAELLLVGYIFIVLIVILNIAVFIASVVEAINNKTLRKKLISNSAIMLLNIPIAYLYIWIMMILLNTIRLTLVNPTDSRLTDLKLSGCESMLIDELKAGESKTIWISIENDCSVILKFKKEETEKTETIIEYVSNMSGQKTKHIIGKGNQEL